MSDRTKSYNGYAQDFFRFCCSIDVGLLYDINEYLGVGIVSTPVKFFGVIIGVPALIIGLLLVNAFIYPFSSKNPNFSDVEQAFSKLQFPADWQETSSSENRGIAGRGCDPFNSSGCFYKDKKFKFSSDPVVAIKEIFSKAGCETVSQSEFTYKGEQQRSYSFRCTPGSNIYYTASLKGPESTINVGAQTF